MYSVRRNARDGILRPKTTLGDDPRRVYRWWRFYDSCMGLFGHGRGLVRSRACFLGVIVAQLGRGFFPIFVPNLRAIIDS